MNSSWIGLMNGGAAGMILPCLRRLLATQRTFDVIDGTTHGQFQKGTSMPNTDELLGPTAAKVGLVMGSQSDWETMAEASRILDALGVPYEARVVSAHRTPDWMIQYAKAAADRGLHVLIAGAGGAAHLPGMIASCTSLPVLGVPVSSRHLQGLDSLLSIVQMPGGIPVGTLAIGASGAKNAGLLAARILALHDPALRERLLRFTEDQTQQVLAGSVLEGA